MKKRKLYTERRRPKTAIAASSGGVFYAKRRQPAGNSKKFSYMAGEKEAKSQYIASYPTYKGGKAKGNHPRV